jgi:hypothetical protein
VLGRFRRNAGGECAQRKATIGDALQQVIADALNSIIECRQFEALLGEHRLDTGDHSDHVAPSMQARRTIAGESQPVAMASTAALGSSSAGLACASQRHSPSSS